MPKCEPSYKSTLEIEIKRYIYVCQKSKIDADAKRFLCKKSKRSQQEVFSAALASALFLHLSNNIIRLIIKSDY